MDGLPLYDRVADLPERPNVAVLYTPAEGVRDAIAACAAARIRTIVAVCRIRAGARRARRRRGRAGGRAAG